MRVFMTKFFALVYVSCSTYTLLQLQLQILQRQARVLSVYVVAVKCIAAVKCIPGVKCIVAQHVNCIVCS